VFSATLRRKVMLLKTCSKVSSAVPTTKPLPCRTTVSSTSTSRLGAFITTESSPLEMSQPRTCTSVHLVLTPSVFGAMWLGGERIVTP